MDASGGGRKGAWTQEVGRGACSLVGGEWSTGPPWHPAAEAPTQAQIFAITR